MHLDWQFLRWNMDVRRAILARPDFNLLNATNLAGHRESALHRVATEGCAELAELNINALLTTRSKHTGKVYLLTATT